MAKAKKILDLLFGQITQIFSYVKKKGYQKPKEDISEDLLKELSLLKEQFVEFKELNKIAMEKSGEKLTVSKKKELMLALKPRERRIMGQFDRLKKDLIFHRNALERSLSEGRKEEKIPDSKKKAARKKKRAMKKKFRAIDDKWKRL